MKRLVVCCDGTWNNADSQSPETNVALLARSVHATQDTGGIMQVVLYLRGVGTSGLQTEVLIEGAIGLGIDENIRSAYMFIAQNYLPGDEIFLFGFSRGAYTARSLADSSELAAFSSGSDWVISPRPGTIIARGRCRIRRRISSSSINLTPTPTPR